MKEGRKRGGGQPSEPLQTSKAHLAITSYILSAMSKYFLNRYRSVLLVSQILHPVYWERGGGVASNKHCVSPFILCCNCFGWLSSRFLVKRGTD